MQLSDLPDDILFIVLRKCGSLARDKAVVFKRNLPLLSVCQKWRALASPMVYNHMFVCYGDAKLDRLGRPLRDASKNEATEANFRTNLGLIAAAGCKDMVKCVTIKATFSGSAIKGLAKLIESMQQVADEWKKVSKLSITIQSTSFRLDNSDIVMAYYEDDIRKVGNALVMLMPELRQLCIGGGRRSPIAAAICSYVAGFYTEQLQELSSQYPISLSSDRRFKCLKKASIGYDPLRNNHPPSMDTADLETLLLSMAPSNHSWAPFSSNNGSNIIEFAKLKHLDVLYHKVYEENGILVAHRDGHPWKLCFPSLETLSITCIKSICPLHEYILLPSRMKEITIAMKLDDFQRYTKFSVPAANKITLKVLTPPGNDTAGFVTFNCMLDGMRGNGNVELELSSSSTSVLSSSITSTAITRLLVSGPTSVDTMFELIQQLPNLVGLIFRQLDMGNVQTDISVPEAGNHVLMEPYDTKLAGMALTYMQDKHSLDLAAAITKHLLLKILTLTKFFAGQTLVQLVLDFAETYSQQYPHLSSLKFSLADDEESAFFSWSTQVLY